MGSPSETASVAPATRVQVHRGLVGILVTGLTVELKLLCASWLGQQAVLNLLVAEPAFNLVSCDVFGRA